jgi:ribosomal-protein-alanine N-acetyltransferase
MMRTFSFFGSKTSVLLLALDGEHAAACARIHRESFAHPWSGADFESMLSARETISDGLMDSRDHSLQGMILTRVIGTEGEILTVALTKSARYKGNGALLIEHHLSRLTATGVQRLFLEVAYDNTPAVKLYLKQGFVEVGRRSGYYGSGGGPAADAIVMARDL